MAGAERTIELRNVRREFASPDGKPLVALRDFSMTVRRGEFVAIVGPTGCGKSTTLNLITGIAKPPPPITRSYGQPGRPSTHAHGNEAAQVRQCPYIPPNSNVCPRKGLL